MMELLSSKSANYCTVHCILNFMQPRFLSSYTGKEGRSFEESKLLSPHDILNESQDFELEHRLPSCVSDSSSVTITHSLHGEVTEGNMTVSKLDVITPLLLETQRGICLDLKRTGTENSSKDLHIERLVEGSSVKSQPKSRQSRDHTTLTGRQNHSKTVYPSGTGEKLQRGQSPIQSTISSLQSSVTGASCRTTASEAEFRSDLASLDADIARLQMQFRVAMLTPLP